MPEITSKVFGVDDIILKTALINGIKVKKENSWVPIDGLVCLLYINQLNDFVLSYGTLENNGFVFVKNYGKDWVNK